MRFPSKNIIPIIIACVAAAGAIIFAVVYPVHKKDIASANSASLTVVKSNEIENTLRELDSDKDGLKDWEEALWNTNPHNVDSDGDGTNDGDEVKQGRNPSIKGPNDKVNASQTTGTTTVSETTTLTSKVARDLFTNYMKLKQSNKELTPDLEDGLIQETLNAINIDATDSKVYTEKDIKITSDISTNSLHQYANAMGKIFRTNHIENAQNELLTFTNALESGNETDINKLDPIIALYKKIVQEGLKISVPEVIASQHVQLLNGYSTAVEADLKLRKLFEDATASLIGLRQYQTASSQIVDSHVAIEKYFKDQGVTFNAEEDGYAFLSIIPIQ